MKKNLLRLTLLSIAVLASFTTAWGEDKVSGEPILIPANPQDTMILWNGVEYQLAIPATEISDVLSSYMDDSTLVEGQVFYLEGGQEYFIRNYVLVYKGFKLVTNPADLNAGKGRAKVYLGGLAMDGSTVQTANFMLGRDPINDEDADEVIEMESIIFEDIDFDCPLAQNYLESETDYGTGNYFFNEITLHPDTHVKEFTVRNCSFQHLIRGFHRIQGDNETTIDNYLVENCEFYNCGGYAKNSSGYGIVCGDPLSNLNTNIFRNMVWRNNTFFDTPIGAFITNFNRNIQWTDPTQAYNITVENNTFVNFNTIYSSSYAMITLRYLPIGSTLNINNNLFVQTKQEGDERTLYLMGSDIRELSGTYEGITVFNIGNNWSTNDNIDTSTGEVFTSNSFSATTSSIGKWLNSNPEFYPQGADELKVHVADISATDLMYQPNPPHKQVGEPGALDHSTDDLEGKGEFSANLYFKDFDNDIVRNNVGASKWRTIVEDKEEPGTIEPVEDTKEISFSDMLDGETDLSDIVIDNTYYNMNADNGDGYDASEQAIVLNSTTTEEQMESILSACTGDDLLSENFNGIILEVPAGFGVVTVDVKTIGTHVLNVRVGSAEPTKVARSERGTVDVAYDVTEPTYVYIYASTGEGSPAFLSRAASADANSVLLYGYKVTLGATGVSLVQLSQPFDVYDIRGNMVRVGVTNLDGLPRDIYVVNGRKVVVK